MKKIIASILAAAILLSLTFCLTACGDDALKIAVPNDTTNEARALLLLENLGLLKLKENAGITATILDIVDNPHNIEFSEVEAAQIPNVLPDVDFAVINSNFALDAGLNPAQDALALEGSFSAYSNILTVKAGNEELPEVKALTAALCSQRVADFITSTYAGAVVSVVDQPTDGYDATVDYAALNGTTITVAATPNPHAEILAICKEILADKGITLEIQEVNDYVIPNNIVEDGTVLANFFQHAPYMDDFNAQNGTHLVSVAAIHVEPMGIYGGRQSSLDAIQ